MDQLSAFLQQFSISAGVFYSGQLCGFTDFGETQDSVGHVHVLRRGKLKVQQPQSSTEVNEPSLIFFPQAQAHRLHVDQHSNAEMVCATIKFNHANKQLTLNALPAMLVLLMERQQKLMRTTELLFDEAFAPEPGSQLVMNKLVEVLITLLLRDTMQQQQVSSGIIAGLLHPKLSKALLAVNALSPRQLSVELLAEQVMMSRTSFIETFNKVIGSSPGEYLLHWRINQAQQQLLRGKAVSWVAEEVGYQSLSGFTRAFRLKTQLSPKQWLAQQQA